MIILRNIPKERVRIDLTSFEIGGGFRGFQNVPAGAHYISVLSDGAEVGEWLYLQPDDVIVRVFNAELGRFEEDTPESEAEFKQRAASGVMNKALAAYPMENSGRWAILTRHIAAAPFPPTIFSEDTGNNPGHSRFEKALFGTHQGNTQSFLAEFEFAFLVWAVDANNAKALERWRHLLLAVYNAGQSTIEDNQNLFAQLADLLIAQFELWPAEFFKADSFVVANATYLLEDLQDTRQSELVSKSQKLADFLAKKTV